MRIGKVGYVEDLVGAMCLGNMAFDQGRFCHFSRIYLNT